MTEQPHSLSTPFVSAPKAPTDAFTERFGRFPKGTKLPETTTPYSPRRRVADFPPGFLKQKHIEHLEQNQKLPHCCRHPENHEVEGLKSHPQEQATDIYIFHCTCGQKHRFFCVGMNDVRPEWR